MKQGLFGGYGGKGGGGTVIVGHSRGFSVKELGHKTGIPRECCVDRGVIGGIGLA